jgi:putative SOS response-associated peptidase YedK
MNTSTDFLPSQAVPVVRLNPQTHHRELVHLQWGMVPTSAADPSAARRLTHARSETVATKPSFRDSFRQRRCLLVVDSFNLGKRSRRAIQMKDGKPFGIAAIWDRWQAGDGEPLETCAVITMAANDLVLPINDRMPAIIAKTDHDRWLDPEFFDLEELERMMEVFPSKAMVISP